LVKYVQKKARAMPTNNQPPHPIENNRVFRNARLGNSFMRRCFVKISDKKSAPKGA
jgi:hypothetical protein